MSYEPKDDAELYDVLGGASSYRPSNIVPLAPRIDARDAAAMPGSDELTDSQITDAIYRVHEDTTEYPQFPWEKLAELSGPMCPEDLIIVGARTGGGKSLFLQNLFDSFVVAGRIGLYVGLEQSPLILRIKWACLRRDIPPRLVLATRKSEKGTPEHEAAKQIVQEELAWQKSPAVRVRAHFSAERTINASGLRRWTEWAVDHGCEFVIVDHIDRVEHGDGKNPFHELSTTIRLAKELATKHRITMILASQVGRPGDPLERFMPPALHQLRGGGTKEEEADTVLGIFRPLRANTTDNDLKLVRQGLRDANTIVEPDTMGVMLLKHRLDGPVANKVVHLGVRHQRVFDLAERDRWTTDGGYPRQML